MPYPRYSIDEQGNPVDWDELIETEASELARARQRIAELEAKNRELLAIADNTALIMAGHNLAQLEETRKELVFKLDHAESVGRGRKQRVTELKEALERFVAAAQAVIESPCEVNWTALQYNIVEARRLL
jgi:hypothetical protein